MLVILFGVAGEAEVGLACDGARDRALLLLLLRGVLATMNLKKTISLKNVKDKSHEPVNRVVNYSL